MKRGALAIFSAMVALASCGAIPDEGPSTAAIVGGGLPNGKQRDVPFVVIDVNAETVSRLQASALEPNRAGAIPARDAGMLMPSKAVGAIGAGDLLHIAVWQADQSGTTLLDHSAMELNARVDADGTISVPYAGRVHVAGYRSGAAERAVAGRLTSQTVAPQASVLVMEDQTNYVLVAGDIARPGRVPLAEGGRRLMDVIALAGGPRRADYQTDVTVRRGQGTLHTGMLQLAADPALDVDLSPGDRVILGPIDRHFYAFGAVNRPGQQDYNAPSMTILDALGRIAGLQDGRANPAGLFIFRRQSEQLTRQLLAVPTGPGTDITQVVYRVNLRDPTAFFEISMMSIQPGDILYVSNAPLAELGKFASILAGINSVASTPRNFGAY